MNYTQTVLKFTKLITEAQKREAVTQGQSLSPIPATVYRFFCFVLLTIFFISIRTVCAEVPVLIPTEPNIRWITDPTAKPIAEPKMKWGDTTRKFDPKGQPISWAKDPTVVRFNGRYLMYFTLLPNEKDKKTGCVIVIGIAESTDLVHWKTIAELPPFQACDAKGLGAPCGRVWNNKVYLFYQSYGTGAKDGICLAWSDDGIHFTPHSKNPIFKPHGDWTNTRAIDADAIIFKGKLFFVRFYP
jgi:hypothetical protein